MTTQQVADKLVAYCKKADWDNAIHELYHAEAVSIEMPGAPGFPPRTQGKEALIAKGEQWSNMLETFHGVEVEGPIVAGDHFSCTLKMDVTMKGAPRMINEEVGVYQVKDGKVVSEQFFYPVK